MTPILSYEKYSDNPMYEIDRLKVENASLRHQVLELTEQNRAYLAEVTKLHDTEDTLQKCIAQLEGEAWKLRAEIERMNRIITIRGIQDTKFINCSIEPSRPTTVQEAARLADEPSRTAAAVHKVAMKLEHDEPAIRESRNTEDSRE